MAKQTEIHIKTDEKYVADHFYVCATKIFHARSVLPTASYLHITG